ncbi:unnamed protein product [Cochlearia groenlandica]
MSPMDLLATVAENSLFEDNCVVTQNTVKEEFAVDENPLKPVTLFQDIAYQGSLSTCGFSSVINGKVENDAGNFSNSGGSDAVVVDARSNVVVSLGSNSSRTKLPPMGNGVSHGVLDGVNLISRDDDENFSEYIHSQVTKNSSRFVPRSGDRRIRKILASRHWKGDSKPWRTNYLHHQRSYPAKQRGSSAVSSKKGRVKLCIKSFKVPELYVEIPESSTVGSLKRMVMEAVSTLLSDGYQVGLMFHGKKVRDDHKTLHQTGISRDKTQLEYLDFCLEPSSEAPQLLARFTLLFITQKQLQLLERTTLWWLKLFFAFGSYPAGHPCEEPFPVCQAANMDNVLECDHDPALFPSDSLCTKNTKNDSKAMVPCVLSELSPRPLCHKSKSSEQQHQAAQRRIRRPFSVAEVEALVEAVEKIGTGRWRDIKLCASEVVADHRTYVDLKDKWKTLVHTAKITPQQRRGEPVPQELLNRVLNAHGYWSQQQNVSKEEQKQETVVSETEALLLVSN